ncbi:MULTISPECIES: YceI family protein [Micrococcaceae]|uniref:YceI family protein n=1 Tax=Micrococcaceae TaxID=1268 RepID=UPI0006CF2E23|nr:YceI family protein [Arthrobacter sp. JCM 19049]
MTTAAATDLTTGTWNLDAAHSEVSFVVRHAGISRVRGNFTDFDATLTVGDSLADSAVEATIQVASVSTKDANRDAHLKGEDFFDAENFPVMSFRSLRAEGGDDFTLIGEMTIKGVTKEVELEAEFGGQTVDPFGMTRAGFSATTTISRKEFGITWNAALEAGGMLVSDKVKIEIDAAFVLPAAE